jgi:hypothetical protein
MALTQYQTTILKLLSERRKTEGISYIAGGTALNKLLNAPRISNDIDIFHDTSEALASTWEKDRQCLLNANFTIDVLRHAPTFIEARIYSNTDEILIQWVRDSAYRFFPVVEDEMLGLTLHPFDLATNKTLALAGRLEVRDWIDTIECHKSLQQLGYLIWSACGKDPGINPAMILNDASRMHYSREELDILDFGNNPPSAENLSLEWKKAITSAKKIIDILPEEHLGECVLGENGLLFNDSIDNLLEQMKHNRIRFHKGSIGGAWPQIVR